MTWKTPKPAHWILHQTGNVTQHQFIDSEMFHPPVFSPKDSWQYVHTVATFSGGPP